MSSWYEFELIDFRPVGECWPERVRIFKDKNEAIAVARQIVESGYKLMTFGMDGPVQTTLNELMLPGSLAIFPPTYIDLPDAELDKIRKADPDTDLTVIARSTFTWWARLHKKGEEC